MKTNIKQARRETSHSNSLHFLFSKASPCIFVCLLGSREGYGYTFNAFVFSISNKEELDPFKINNLRWPSYAIWSSSRCGPGFGEDQIIILLKEDGTSLARLGIDYPAPAAVQDPNTILAGSKYFLPDEVEVFYLNPTQ